MGIRQHCGFLPRVFGKRFCCTVRPAALVSVVQLTSATLAKGLWQTFRLDCDYNRWHNQMYILIGGLVDGGCHGESMSPFVTGTA